MTHQKMKRRQFLQLGAASGALALTGTGCVRPASTPSESVSAIPAFEFEEATVANLQTGMETGAYTARSITERYLERIEALDKQGPALHAIIETNPDALAIAGALDEERRTNGPRGPLHGIPILVKDNIDTADRMHTSAGSAALAGSIAPQDSFVAQKLREAGAIILGKANLSEWANFRSTRSSSGWSGRGGQARNPYILDRSPCGSSSGSGVAAAANLCALAIGTETNGSIVCPSTVNGLVGIKPTVGAVSRSGIIPIAHSQDTAGPMARTVTDAALLLGALTGADPRDPITAQGEGRAITDFTSSLDANGLQGARIGIARNYLGFHEKVDALIEEAIDVLRQQGAEVIDEANIETRGQYGDASFDVLLYEFKADLNLYLSTLDPSVEVKTLEDLIAYNEANKDVEMPYFQQEIFELAQEKGPLTDQGYKDALAKIHRLSRDEGIDATMQKHNLDAILACTGGPAWPIDLITGDHFLGGCSSPAARAGYPHITVPAGFVHGLPIGLSFFAGAWAEPRLIQYAYAFEQATNHRRPPQFLPTFTG